MITSTRSKIIKSLQIKKYRQRHGLFLVQGRKNILELLASDMVIEELYSTKEFIKELESNFDLSPINVIETSQNELEKNGTLESNDAGLAIVEKPDVSEPIVNNDFIVALDNIRDPGNLGTIIRICDWYGISKIVCSDGCVDLYNPKVISATMGSFTRIGVYYCPLDQFLTNNKDQAIMGAVLEGENIHSLKLPKSGVLVIGNESQGISEDIQKLLNCRLSIPKFGGAESLNAGIATAIICDHLVRSANA